MPRPGCRDPLPAGFYFTPPRLRADLAETADSRRPLMWPNDFETWISRMATHVPGFLGQDEWHVRNMLRQYPPLFDGRDPVAPGWDYSRSIAREAATRARAVARSFYAHGVPPGPPLFPGLIRDAREFERWLTNMAYRQALRLALLPERVEAELRRLPPEQQRLLYWRYLDRWTDAEVATALRFTLTPGRLTTPAEARTLSTQAYRALCDRLRVVIPVGGRDVTTFFPVFPGGSP